MTLVSGELAPCPFCGATDPVILSNAIECSADDCSGAIIFDNQPSDAALAAAWNRRPK